MESRTSVETALIATQHWIPQNRSIVDEYATIANIMSCCAKAINLTELLSPYKIDRCVCIAYIIYLSLIVLGMTLNCIHIFIVTGGFLYSCVMRPRPVSVFSYTVVFIYESWSYLIKQRFLALIAFMCWCAVKQSINQPQPNRLVSLHCDVNVVTCRGVSALYRRDCPVAVQRSPSQPTSMSQVTILLSGAIIVENTFHTETWISMTVYSAVYVNNIKKTTWMSGKYHVGEISFRAISPQLRLFSSPGTGIWHKKLYQLTSLRYCHADLSRPPGRPSAGNLVPVTLSLETVCPGRLQWHLPTRRPTDVPRLTETTVDLSPPSTSSCLERVHQWRIAVVWRASKPICATWLHHRRSMNQLCPSKEM